MKKTALLLAAAALFTTFLASGALARDSETWNGEYVWNHRDNRGDLEAVFTSTGEGSWDVAFHFRFSGKRHVYEGKAQGSLTEGRLEGRVRNENKRRTFTFEGTVENGRFRGSHAEIEDGRAFDTGTLTLRR